MNKIGNKQSAGWADTVLQGHISHYRHGHYHTARCRRAFTNERPDPHTVILWWAASQIGMVTVKDSKKTILMAFKFLSNNGNDFILFVWNIKIFFLISFTFFSQFDLSMSKHRPHMFQCLRPLLSLMKLKMLNYWTIKMLDELMNPTNGQFYYSLTCSLYSNVGGREKKVNAPQWWQSGTSRWR